MKQIAVADLSAQLSSLLDDVARGEEITLIDNGKPVAKLGPAYEKLSPVPEYSPEEIEIRRAALKRLRDNAREIGITASQEEIKSWIEEGRH